ncbi:MAG: multicopper oxidase domain-containing protein, partial [Rhodospirillales bacterium]|nr:multicopper oxidase domain-containing protein [Rhodospirillales bacterium]
MMMNLKNCFLALAVLVAAIPFAAKAGTYDLTIAETTVNIVGEEQRALSINGGIPGPVLHFKEGEDLVINVTNKLDEDTSIHW